jgi:hypothetical protein
MSVYKLPMMWSMGGGGGRSRGGVGLEKLVEDLVAMEVWVGMLVHPEMKENVRTLGNQPGQASQAVATQRLSYAGHHQVA